MCYTTIMFEALVKLFTKITTELQHNINQKSEGKLSW